MLFNKDDDIRLFKKVKKGNYQAFETLYKRYKGPMMNYIYTFVKDREKSEEIFQETFSKIYSKRDSFHEENKFSTWAWTIARNTSFDYLRKHSKMTEDSYSLEKIENENLERYSFDSKVIARSQIKDLHKALEKLSMLEKESLLLHLFSNQKQSEIAKKLDVSLSAVKVHIHRAKIKIQESIKDEK